MTQAAYPALSEAQVPVSVNFGSFPYQAENWNNIIWCFKQPCPRNGCRSAAGEHIHTFMWFHNYLFGLLNSTCVLKGLKAIKKFDI